MLLIGVGTIWLDESRQWVRDAVLLLQEIQFFSFRVGDGVLIIVQAIQQRPCNPCRTTWPLSPPKTPHRILGNVLQRLIRF